MWSQISKESIPGFPFGGQHKRDWKLGRCRADIYLPKAKDKGVGLKTDEVALKGAIIPRREKEDGSFLWKGSHAWGIPLIRGERPENVFGMVLELHPEISWEKKYE